MIIKCHRSVGFIANWSNKEFKFYVILAQVTCKQGATVIANQLATWPVSFYRN